MPLRGQRDFPALGHPANHLLGHRRLTRLVLREQRGCGRLDVDNPDPRPVIARELSLGLSLFCEYCYAVHSITYGALPDYSLVFGARDDREGRWWDWDMVVAQAADLGLPTVPELYRGQVSTARELEALTLSLAAQPSVFGGPREGVVVRHAGEFRDAVFQRSLAKWVRHDHVTTDEHWMHQNIRAQKLAKSEASS